MAPLKQARQSSHVLTHYSAASKKKKEKEKTQEHLKTHSAIKTKRLVKIVHHIGADKYEGQFSIIISRGVKNGTSQVQLSLEESTTRWSVRRISL